MTSFPGTAVTGRLRRCDGGAPPVFLTHLLHGYPLMSYLHAHPLWIVI